MHTRSGSPALESALAGLPNRFRSRVITAYVDLKRNALESRYDAAGICVGKLCEVVLRLLQEKIHGKCTPLGSKIGNFADECRRLIVAPASRGNESERIVLPRALVYLYTMRNKRGIGHVGGDVDANQIDTATMARAADWVVCELIRINHGLSLGEAQDIVDGISVRQIPAVWQVAGRKRVLRAGLLARDETLLLLYSSGQSYVPVEDLCDWVEYSSVRMFKSRVIHQLHKQRLVEHDRDTDSVLLSPKGAAYVEANVL